MCCARDRFSLDHFGLDWATLYSRYREHDFEVFGQNNAALRFSAVSSCSSFIIMLFL